MEGRKLYRSRTDRMVWGVCGGLAEYFGVDPTIVRIIMVLLALANGLGLLLYAVLAIVLPVEGSREATPRETIRDNVVEMKESAGRLGEELGSTLKGGSKAEVFEKVRHRSVQVFGAFLILIGALLLLENLGFLWWLRWGFLWPLAVVAIGILIIVSARR